jgi:nucleotide-binding universal stress UspA family protein
MKVLVAVSTRLSGRSDPVAELTAFPWPAGTMFRVLSVAELASPPPMVEAIPGVGGMAEVQAVADEVAGQTAESTAAELRKHGLQAEGWTEEGDPRNAIIDHAKDWHADLIVLGACEKSGLEKFFAGSVSEGVVKHAPCSVLVIKPHDAEVIEKADAEAMEPEAA